MPHHSHKFKRALVIRFGGMGDILLATPTVRALTEAYPGIEIDFIVGKGMGDSLNGSSLVRHVIVFDKSAADKDLRYFLPFLSRIVHARYDLIVNLHPSAKSFLMALVSGARRHLTFRKHMEVRADTGKVAHAVDDFTKELKPLGITAVTDRRMEFVVPDAAQTRVDGLLAELGVLETDRLLVINPAASRPINRWPLERFAALAAHFAARPQIKVVLTGAPSTFHTVLDNLDEVGLARRIAESDSRILNLAGQLTVKEFGALLCRADTLLTCDTGPMHIGAALHTPLVVLSGAADPDRTGPLTDNATVLIDHSLSCVPCRDRTCARGDIQCMQNLSLQAVISAVEHRLALPYAGRIPLPLWD